LATARLGDLLDSLPAKDRSDDWEVREQIIAEFLDRKDQRTQESGWSFSFFAASFNGLRVPPENRPRPVDLHGQPIRRQATY
jgi:hypothetical protein